MQRDCKIQAFYSSHYASSVCSHEEDMFYRGLENVEDWSAIISEAFFQYIAHRLHKISAHMNQEDYDQLKEIALLVVNSVERDLISITRQR